MVRSKFFSNKFDLDEMIQSINHEVWWNMSKTTTVDKVLNFWFNECTPEQWYKKDADFDALIFRRFETAVSAALKGEVEAWQTDLKGCLAIILMLDQFTRNIYRNTPKGFLGDRKALELSLVCHDKGYLQHDHPTYRRSCWCRWCTVKISPFRTNL